MFVVQSFVCYIEPLGSDSNKVYSDSDSDCDCDSDSDEGGPRRLCSSQPGTSFSSPWLLRANRNQAAGGGGHSKSVKRACYPPHTEAVHQSDLGVGGSFPSPWLASTNEIQAMRYRRVARGLSRNVTNEGRGIRV